MITSSVLVVGRNELLPQVVRHLLPHPAPAVFMAANMDEALTYAGQPVRLVLADLPEGGEGGDRLGELYTAFKPAPLVVLAPDPAALPPLPPEWQPPPRVLPHPPDLDALGRALREAWEESEPGRPGKATPFMRRAAFIAGAVVIAAGLLLILPVLGVPFLPNLLKAVVAHKEAESAPPATPITLVHDERDTFLLNEASRAAMKIPEPHQIAERPVEKQLVLSGSLAFDPDKLGRVQPRFQGEVISIGTSTDPTYEKGRTVVGAPLTYGSRVKKGQLMAVIWSKDLGEKKSELVDSLVKLSLDEENLKHLKDLWTSGAGSEANYRQAKNTVSADLNAVARARRTLETWKVEESEIKAIEKEADRIIATRSLAELRKMRTNVEKWARVEVTAPFDGIVVEKNLAVGNMVDPTQDLYRVADLRRLAVFANAYEEDQRILQRMQGEYSPAPVPWYVFLTSDPAKRRLPSQGIERIGYIVDPQQKTNLAIGKVENGSDRVQGGDLRVGQSVTAFVNVPAPKNVVAVPASALVEDGKDSVVFVQDDPKKLKYRMKRVVVEQRFTTQPLPDEAPNGPKAVQQWAYVSSTLDAKQRAAGLEPLRPGDWVVASAVVELKAALEEVQARERRDTPTGNQDRPNKAGEGR